MKELKENKDKTIKNRYILDNIYDQNCTEK